MIPKHPLSQHPRNVIGLLPAGGQAKRISPLPLSKELYPIGFHPLSSDNSPRPKAVGHYLLEKMQLAGISKAFIIVRPGKWDIPAYFGDGARFNISLAYLTVHFPFGTPFTLDQAYPFVQDAVIALGFPDILFQPADAYRQLLTRQSQGQADVVLGLFPTAQPHKAGMVEFDPSGQVHRIIEKPQQTDLKYMWAIAVWTSSFTQFLHEFVEESLRAIAKEDPLSIPETPIGDVIQAAINAGFRVEAEVFPQGRYLDIGAPENLMQATAHWQDW